MKMHSSDTKLSLGKRVTISMQYLLEEMINSENEKGNCPISNGKYKLMCETGSLKTD